MKNWIKKKLLNNDQSTIGIYYPLLRVNRRKSLLIVCLMGLSGLLEGMALVTLLPVLKFGLGFEVQRFSGFIDFFTARQVSSSNLMLLGILFFTGFGILSALIKYFGQCFLEVYKGNIEESMQRQFIASLFNCKWECYIKLQAGKTVKLLFIDASWTLHGALTILEALGVFVTIIILLAGAVWMQPYLAMATLFFAALIFVVYYHIGKKYHRETGQVQYQSKDEKETKVFDALEWLAAMCSHVPGKGEQMARYYGHYSNVARGKRKKAGTEDKIPCILEPELTGTAFRKNWARLIQKIYEVNPLICPYTAPKTFIAKSDF